jgi:4-hydroxy-2-oxoheptanedioate aldolase
MISLCAQAGWDYVIVDTEHTEGDLSTLASQALVAKYEALSFLVRVPDKLYHQMARVLDIGAEGLILPRVDTREEVQRIIRSTKYYPLGERGASVSTAVTRFRPVGAQEYMEWANREILIVIQIESQKAVDNIDELVSYEGVDAVMIGPMDLSQNMGIAGQLDHPLLEEAYEKVIAGCRRHGVAPGIHLSNLDAVAKWVGRGMRFVTYQYDGKLLLDTCSTAVAKLRNLERG